MSQQTTDFQKLFETAPGLFIVLLPDLTIITATDDYLKVAKKTRAELAGKKFFDMFPDTPGPSGKGVLRDSFEKVLQSGAPDILTARKYDIPRPASEGGGFDIRYWNSINMPIKDAEGKITHIIRRVDDVTGEVHAKGERSAIEKERDFIFQHSLDLFATVGTDGYFKRTNPAFKHAMGYTEEELCARPIVSFLHPDDVSRTKKGIQTLASGIPTISSKNRYLCKDGTYKWFSWNTMPMGDLLYTVGRDVTDQIAAEERIQKLNLELERKNEGLEHTIQERMKELQKSEAQLQQLQKMDAVGRLAGGIAHDFNNILGAISLYCDLLMNNATNPDAVLDNIGDLRTATDRATALTRQLLIFSRQQVSDLQTVKLNPLIKNLQKMLTRLIGENIKIVTKFSPDLKDIRVDPSQMEQVILNLVVNARDAMPHGGVITLETSNVHLDATAVRGYLNLEPGNYVLFSVKDEGCGMDAATLTRIFEPFFTTKSIGKGTGLGLSTTYGIVKRCKGTILVDSELDKGSLFKIYLPVSEQGIEEPEDLPATPPPSLIKEKTILLVEDDDALRRGFSTILESKGFQMLIAANGPEALALMQAHQGTIHLLLTDMIMPGMSGIELAEQAMKFRKDLKVLYMSGYTADNLDTSKISSPERLLLIQKPFNTETLIAKLQEALTR